MSIAAARRTIPPACRIARVVLQHGIGPAHRSGTCRILRIASIQVRREFGGHRGGSVHHRLCVGVVGDAGYYSGRLHRLFRASGGMADALASGASVLRDVGVQVPLRPPAELLVTATNLPCKNLLNRPKQIPLSTKNPSAPGVLGLKPEWTFVGLGIGFKRSRSLLGRCEWMV
jgi:hypothetical protein